MTEPLTFDQKIIVALCVAMHNTDLDCGWNCGNAMVHEYAANEVLKMLQIQGYSLVPTISLDAKCRELDVKRLIQLRPDLDEWLDTERLLDGLTVDDGAAYTDAVDFSIYMRQRLVALLREEKEIE